MDNTSKSNLEYQYKILMESLSDELKYEHDYPTDINDLDCDVLIEKLQGVKEIQVALKTLTN